MEKFKVSRYLTKPHYAFMSRRITLLGCTLRRDSHAREVIASGQAIMSLNSFNSRSTLKVGSKEYEIHRLDALDQQGISTRHLPFSLRILLENLLRTEDGRNVSQQEIRALAA